MRRLLLTALTAFFCLAAPTAAQQLVHFGDQTYSFPYYVTGEPGNPSRVYVVEGAGRIRVVVNGVTQPGSFLDISGDVCDGADTCTVEGGMFSAAFAPDFATSGLFYVFYTRDAADQHDLVIREFRRTTDPNHVDEATGRDVLVIPHPGAANHNGGQLQFGPDGYLYISTGDGGFADDPLGNAQNVNSLLGKLLRIDPHGASDGDHTTPADNPFAGATPGADEIYSYGLRNPYRFSFDRLTGDLTIGDVGQGAWEEIDFLPNGAGRGVNFGWDCFEGLDPAASSGEPQCTAPPLVPPTPPVFQYPNPNGSASPGASINGGFVVRDLTLPTLLGRYVYADSSNAFPEIRSISLAPGGSSGDSDTGLAGHTASFGEDACGHIYVAKFDGTVSRIQPSSSPPACQPQTAHASVASPARDSTAPTLRVRLRKARHAGDRGEVIATITADEACTVRGEGEIVLPGKDIDLDPASGPLQPGVPGSLHLDLSPRETKRLRARLLDGVRAKAVLDLVAADAVGNSRAARYRAKQRP